MHEREPTPQAIAAIQEHLVGTHNRADFDLARDVSWVNNNPDSALIVYLPESGISPARFTCKDERCVGLILPAGDPTYGHPERNAWLLLAHPELRTTLLAGVGDLADQALLLEDWDRGRLGRARVAAVRKRRSMATKKAHRPSVDARRTRCQDFLLGRVRCGAIVQDAIGALDGLRASDPFAYEYLMGGPDRRSTEALKKYWRDIPIAVRNAARAEGARARAATRAGKAAP
jgi:hypothetical protein